MSSIPRWQPVARFVESDAFQAFIAAAIVLNAIELGLATYPAIATNYGTLLEGVNNTLYLIFLIELVLRIVSYGRRPWNFFRSGWNVFDFIIIGGALVPALRDQATILRLLRLARVVRLMRFLPDARVLITTMAKAIPSLFSMIVLVVLIIFIYGILGWSLYGQSLPDEWGTIGQAMLTLFILLTLENFPAYLQQAQPYSGFTTLFFLSYVLIAVFVVINLLIGIIIGSMEKAREQQALEARTQEQDEHTILIGHLIAMREQLDEIEAEVELLRFNKVKGSRD